MFEHVGFKKAAQPVEAEVLTDAAVNGEGHVELLSFVVNFMKRRRTVKRDSVVRDRWQESGAEAKILYASA